MPKKNINGVLIFVAVIIWGVLIFKFITPYFGTNESVEASVIPSGNFEKKLLHKKDTFLLKSVDYDPFLAKNHSQQKTFVKKITGQKTKKTKRTTWPKLTYLGFVKSKGNKNKLGLLRVDNKLHRVKPKETVNGLYVYKIYNDSIGLKLGSEKKYFKK